MTDTSTLSVKIRDQWVSRPAVRELENTARPRAGESIKLPNGIWAHGPAATDASVTA